MDLSTGALDWGLSGRLGLAWPFEGQTDASDRSPHERRPVRGDPTAQDTTPKYRRKWPVEANRASPVGFTGAWGYHKQEERRFLPSPPKERAPMVREYCKGYSRRLGREMELLIFGHAGLPVLVFPTSGGRFFDFEDRGMVAACAGKIDAGQLQLICVDSVDAESWYNRTHAPRWRIARHLRYEEYLLHELLPLIRQRNPDPQPGRAGLQFRRLSRRQHRPAPSRRLHRLRLALRRLRPDELSRRLLRPGLLLQPAHALPAQPDRPVVSRALPPQPLRAGHRLGRPVPGAEPEPRPHPERQGDSPPAPYLGRAQLPRLAHLAAHGAGVSVTGTREFNACMRNFDINLNMGG